MPEVPVKAFVRIRPLLLQDRAESGDVCVRAVSHDQLVLGKDRSFRFDRVFPPETPQTDVYRHCVAPLVSACLEGYNATVFAYGQTGSGKSHTIGSEGGGGARGEGQGIVPRALEEIFRHIQASPGVEFAVRVSYVEVYKEEPRDLLEGGVSGREVLIREDQQGNTVVMGCREEDVRCVDDALGWLEAGNAARVTGATRMNQRSSRSHAVFTVSVEQKWKLLPDHSQDTTPTSPLTKEATPTATPTDEAVEQRLSSKFHFVDLAGSERVSRTGNLGERFKESVHINSGLLALGNVISALGDPKRKSTHVPYRESKITRILKDSLGGNARTVMITCLSPAAANFAENLNSLKYAKRARNIRNRPIVNRDPQAHRLQEMKEEIEALRGELQRARLSSKPSTVATTVDTSVMVELSDVEAHMGDLEQELALSRQRCSQYHAHLLAVRDQLLALRGATASSSLPGVVGSEVMQGMEGWLASLADLEEATPVGQLEPPPQPDQHSPTHTTHSPISKRALEAIEMLQAELQQCHIDLETDEELFSEKVDELNSLQTNYNTLLQEKDRIEQMWTVAMEAEGQLRQDVEQLLERLSALERELSSRDSTIEELRGQLGERGRDEPQETQGGETSTIDDYTDEKVLESLRVLTDKLVQAQERSEQAPMAILLAETDARMKPTAQTTDLPLGQTRTISTNASRDPKSTPLEQDNVTDEINRVPTPIELSPCDPEMSHSSLYFKMEKVRNQSQQLETGSDSDAGVGGEGDGHVTVDHLTVGHVIRNGSSAVHGQDDVTEMEQLNQSAMASRREISLAEEKLSNAQDELRNLNLKIRLKEELIRELVKNSRTGKQLNEAYLTKIQRLEQEATSVQKDLRQFQASLQTGPQVRGEGERGVDVKAEEEQKRKLAEAEKKLAALQRKQKETERVVQFGKKSEKRISELEGGIERLRNHQEALKRRLRKETEKKTKLEVDLHKYQQRIQSLQTRSDQQSKVLKIKTEEVAAAQRRLRRLSSRPNSQTNDSESPQLVAQRAWLDAEVERMLQQKEAVEMLEKKLLERERILAEREALTAERDTLEMRRVRSSQAVAREVLRLSMQIESIEGSIKSKGEELRTPKSSSSRQQNTRQEVAKLTQEREKLIQQREPLQQKMKDGTLLPEEEQRKLYELNECIEVLEATVDFKNDSITSKQLDVAQIIQSEEIPAEIQDKLAHLSQSDAKALLARYFEKVVDLRLSGNQQRHAHKELEVELAEQQESVCRLERSLKQAQFEMERRLVSQQKEHEQQVRFLMQQLAESNTVGIISPTEEEHRKIEQMEAKIKQLEKDLYYYKKTSRDLKKRFRGAQVESSNTTAVGASSRDHSPITVKRGHTEALKGGHEASESSMGKGCVEDSLSSATSLRERVEQDHVALPVKSRFKEGSSEQLVESDEIIRTESYESSRTVNAAASRAETEHKPNSHSKGSTSDSRTSSVGTDGTRATVPMQLVGGQATSRSGATSATAGVIRKSKKQLRQLSASDIAERMAQQGTVAAQNPKQSPGAASLVKEHR